MCVLCLECGWYCKRIAGDVFGPSGLSDFESGRMKVGTALNLIIEC